MKKSVKIASAALLLLVSISIGIINIIVGSSTKGKIYNHIEKIPYNRVGLLLGTSKFLTNGQPNLYYKYRIDASEKLFKAGKIDFILISGDNSTKDYNEPTTMKEDLVALGIPPNRIYLDYAGFRTLDSIVRSKEIFGQAHLTIISQQFHVERALFIAKWKGVQAIGYNAKDVNVKYGFKTQLRERFARVKMLLDLVFDIKPKFLGKKIEIK